MECLQAWPEPIVRAQFLSESGERVIPTTYIKPLSERPAAVDDHGNETKQQVNIPVIDLGSLRGGTGVDRDQAIRMISDACREWGFFQVVNHGLSVELVGRARKVWEDFFQLPLEAKEAYANTPKTYEGYGSRVGVDKGMALDWGDYFFLILTPRSTRNMEKWPSLPSFREVIEDYCGEMMKVCGMLMGALSRGLGLEEGYMVEAFGGEEMGATLRANYYPKCPQPDLTLGLSAHSDPGSITILLPDDHVNGLQVRKGDSWVTVQAAPNSLVVNVGDQIQFLSNGIYKSVEHRVIANPGRERRSMAFFYNPKNDAVVGPAPELVTPHRPPLYRPMAFGAYRLYIRTRGPRGKSHLDCMKLIDKDHPSVLVADRMDDPKCYIDGLIMHEK